MSVPQPIIPLLQIGDAFNIIAPHNVIASLLTGGQFHAPIYSEESTAEIYNPSQRSNQIPGITFGYVKIENFYHQQGFIEPESEVKFYIYNKSNEVKVLNVQVNQRPCYIVSTGGNFPCQYERGMYPLVYQQVVVLQPGGAKEVKFKMPTPPVSAQPGQPQQVGDVARVRVEVNVTDEKGNTAQLAGMAVPQVP